MGLIEKESKKKKSSKEQRSLFPTVSVARFLNMNHKKKGLTEIERAY